MDSAMHKQTNVLYLSSIQVENAIAVVRFDYGSRTLMYSVMYFYFHYLY